MQAGLGGIIAAGTQSSAGDTVVLGEVHTGLLGHSGALTSDAARELLALIPQDTVRTWERPVRHAASPVLLTGVDSRLPVDREVRGVGTVAAEVSVTGGQVLQATASARVTVAAAADRRRLPWSHYLTRPGVIEAHRAVTAEQVADGFLSPRPGPGVLDLGGICTHALDRVQQSAAVDRRPPFKVARSRLRWAAIPAADGAGTIRFSLEPGALRTVLVTAPPHVTAQLPELCRDLALHDWLLSSLVSFVDVADIGRRERLAVLRRLQPVVDHLLHMWMPAARLPDELRDYWDEIERRSGFSRQWEGVVRRIRDQIALAGVELAAGPAGPTGARSA